MHKTVQNLINIQSSIKSKLIDLKYKHRIPKIIAVSKTFELDHILPLINHGHIDYGENKVQEAIEKWTDIKIKNNKIKLHLVGKLQTNKVKFALKLFDFIHSLDSEKLAKKIAEEQIKQNLKPKIFIQINIGNEKQKNGIEIGELNSFYQKCTEELGLDIIGLMCLPPINENVANYFAHMKKLSFDINVKELSMGMSQDYVEATKYGATFLRIGSKIFGNRI